MRKPEDMKTRVLIATLSRIINCLPLFPKGSDNIKFTPDKLCKMLEGLLPPKWQQKFNFESYNLSEGTNTQLVETCEAIKCNLIDARKKKKGKP